MDRKKHNLDKAKNPELNYQKVNQFLIYLRDYQIHISETYNEFMQLGLKIELKDNGFELINWHDYLLKNSQIINNRSNKNFSKNNLFKLGSKYNQLNQNCINIQKIIKLLSLEIDLDSSDLFINKVIQNSFSSKSKEYYENEYQNGKILGVQINNQQYISTLNKSEIKQNLPVNNFNNNHSSINTNYKELGISWKNLIALPKTTIDCYTNPFFRSITKSNEAYRSADENIDNEVKFNNTFLNKITFKNQKDKIAVTAILKSLNEEIKHREQNLKLLYNNTELLKKPKINEISVLTTVKEVLFLNNLKTKRELITKLLINQYPGLNREIHKFKQSNMQARNPKTEISNISRTINVYPNYDPSILDPEFLGTDKDLIHTVNIQVLNKFELTELDLDFKLNNLESNQNAPENIMDLVNDIILINDSLLLAQLKKVQSILLEKTNFKELNSMNSKINDLITILNNFGNLQKLLLNNKNLENCDARELYSIKNELDNFINLNQNYRNKESITKEWTKLSNELYLIYHQAINRIVKQIL